MRIRKRALPLVAAAALMTSACTELLTDGFSLGDWIEAEKEDTAEPDDE